jgi:hypothetical protein
MRGQTELLQKLAPDGPLRSLVRLHVATRNGTHARDHTLREAAPLQEDLPLAKQQEGDTIQWLVRW